MSAFGNGEDLFDRRLAIVEDIKGSSSAILNYDRIDPEPRFYSAQRRAFLLFGSEITRWLEDLTLDVVGARAHVMGAPAVVPSQAGGAADALAREALAHYDHPLERLKAGDWSGFGAELDAVRPLLETLGAERPEKEK